MIIGRIENDCHGTFQCFNGQSYFECIAIHILYIFLYETNIIAVLNVFLYISI